MPSLWYYNGFRNRHSYPSSRRVKTRYNNLLNCHSIMYCLPEWQFSTLSCWWVITTIPEISRKTPDIDMYNKMGCFTPNQKFQGPDKTWRKAKVKKKRFHSTEEHTSDSAGRLPPPTTDPFIRVCFGRGNLNLTKPEHSGVLLLKQHCSTAIYLFKYNIWNEKHLFFVIEHMIKGLGG
jgi:hypothetical protein